MGRLRELAEEKRKTLSQGSLGDFREIAQMKKNYNQNELSSLNTDYINSFVNDANAYFKALNDAYTGLNWSNSNDTTDSITKQWEALEKRKNTIGVWLLNNKGSLDTESYNSLAESIKNLSQGGADSVKAFKDANALYSSFASQGDYDKWYSNYTAKQNEINSVLNADDFEKYYSLGNDAKYGQHLVFEVLGNSPVDYPTHVTVNGKKENFSGGSLLSNFKATATDTEKQLYNYYLGKYGAEKASEYLKSIAEDINYREGQQIFDKIKDNTLAQLGYSAVAGLDSFASGLGNVGKSVIGLFKDSEQKPLPTTAIQYASGMVRDDLANEGFNIGKQSISQIAYDLGNTTANQIPSMAIGVMTSPVVGAILMGASAGGNAYKEMKDLGYTDEQATTYGMITGALEGVLGNILGAVSGIGKNLLGKTAMKSLAKGVNSAAFRAALNFGSEMVSEGIEEGLQEVLSPFVKAIATGFDEIDGVDWSEVGYSAVLGALSAGMLNSVSGIPGTVKTLNTANEIKKANKVDELKQIANTYAPETVAYKIADKVKADTGAFGIARLLYEVNGRLTAQNTTDIREALKDSGYVDKDADIVAEWLAKAVEGQPLTKKQQIALENNPIITKVFADIVLDETSIVNQRTADVGRINDTKVEKKSEKAEAVNEDTAPERGEEAQQTPETVEVENDAEIVDDRSRESLLLALQSTDYDELTKNMLADAYDGNYSIGEYLTAAREGYDYGLVGLENKSIPTDGLYKSILSPSQQKTSYELGVAKAKGVEQTRAKEVESKKKYGANKTGRRKGTVSGANVSLSQMRAKFNDQQNRAYKVISRISEATGIDVVFYSSKADADGKYNGAQGKFTWKNDTIYVDINSGLLSEANATDLANYTMLRTFTHEFVHFIEKNNAEGYNELRRVVFKTLSERGENPDELITNTIAEYGFKDDAYDRASREVVAEALAEILPDSNFVEQLAMENPNVFRRLLEQLKQFIADIKEYFSEMGKVNYRGAEGLKTEVDGTVKYLENIVELFDKVAVGAVENYQMQFEENATTKTSKELEVEQNLAEHSIGVDEELKEVHSLRYAFGRKDAEGNSLDVVKVGKKEFDVEGVAKLVQNVTGRSLEDCRDWVKAEISLANIIMTYPEFLDFEADNRYEAIKKNSDYPQGTVDLSNKCVKREEFTAMFDLLQKTYPNRVFTAQDIADMRNILREHKITVACGACFVEDRRQLLGEIADTYIDMWKTAVNSGKPLTKINAEGKPIKLGVTTALAKKYGLKQGEDILATDKYIPTQYDLTTYEGFKVLQREHPLIAMGFERYNNSRGQQAGRLIEGRAEYDHQILGWSNNKVKQVNNSGGLRIFSFSDFEAVHLLDLVQIIIDCSARGVKIQGYTKVPAFAKLIRNTGIKLNRSLIPKGNTGIKVVNGKEVLDIDTVEGIDINDKDFMDEADNPDVGNIIIGINPKQIGIAMLDNFVDYIIPFHTNKSSAVCKKLGVGAWVNYKESQREKDIETGKASKHNVNIYTEVIDKYHPTNKVEFVNAFLEECRRQKKIPRYAEFLNKEYTEDGIYTDEGGSFNYTYREGYHKFPIDFKMFDKNGNILPQKNIVPDLNEDVIKEITDAEVKRKQNYEFPEDLYREIDSIFGKTSTTPNDQIEQGDDEVEQFSLRHIVDKNGKDYGIGVYLDSELLSNLTETERIQMVKEYIKELGGRKFSAYDKNGKEFKIEIAKYKQQFVDDNGEKRLVNKDLATKFNRHVIKQESIALIDEVILASNFDSQEDSHYSHGWVDNFGKNKWEYFATYVVDKNNTIWRVLLNIAKTNRGENILYDINKIREISQSVEVGPILTSLNGQTNDVAQVDNIVSQSADSVNTQNEGIEQNQLRTKPLTDTEVLRIAMDRLDTDEYTPSEKVTIKSLNEKLDKLAELEAQRTELGKLYKEQQFGKDGDRNEAIKTYNRMQILDKQINKNRAEILSIEDKQMFRTILQKARKVVETEQKQYDAQKYKDAKARQEETARKNKYREIIRADVNELVKWLTKPDDKKGNRIPDVIKNPIISILRSIDTSSPRLFKGNPVKATKDYRENLKKLQSAFQSEIDAGKLYSGYLDLPEGFMDSVKNLIEQANSLADSAREGFAIASMEAEQLKPLAELIHGLKMWIKNADAFLANSIFQHVSDAADTTINDLMKQKDAGKNTGELYKFFNWTQPRASWIWERFGEGGKAIEKGFIDAQSKLAKNTKAITVFREKTYTQKEAQKWINEINTVKLHGNEIQMPTSYLMGLYLLSKQEDSVRHLINGGFRVGTFTRKGKKYYDNAEHSFGSVQELNSFLDEYFSAEKFTREREVADKIQSFMAKQGAEWGNYVSVARFGEKRFTNPDYYPINSDGKLLESTVDEMPSGADLYALLNMSFTKARNEKATNRLIVYDMFDVFSNHVSAMAQYNAFALPILDALKWFNYKSDISSVRDEIRRVFGAPEEGGKGSGKEGFAETFVKNIIRAYSGTEAMGTAVDEMGMKGLRLHNMAQIAYNFRVVVQQPLSIIRAGVVLNPKYLLKAIKTPLPTTLKSRTEMLDHSGTAVWKDLGFYDINISRGVADIVKGADNWRDKISDVGMRGAKFADDVAWTTMWNACKAQVEAQNSSLARGSDEYWAKVNELFDEVIYKTQVVDTVLTKSEFMRNKGFWSRAMSSFMSEPIASYSMCMGEFDKFNADVKRGLPWNEAFKRNAKSIAKTTAIYSISAVMLSAVTAAMDAARDDDEYEELSEKWWDAFRGNLIDELVPLNKLPIFSDLYEILKILLSKMGVDTYGNPPQSIFAQWYDSLVKGVEILYDKISGEDTNYTYYGGIYKLLQAASSIVGLPIAPLTREVITAWNNTIGRIDPKYKVKTYDSGDLSNIKYAFKDGNLTEDEAIKHILDKGLADNSTIGAENEAYFMVQGWEYGEGYSRYDKLYSAAIDGDGSYYQAIAELTSHGYEEKKIRTTLQTELSRRFKNGTVSWTTAYLVLTQYCDKTKEDAEKLLYNWENA